MSHTTIIISDSLLEIFDPTIEKYAGVRDHFSSEELAKIDALRARPSGSSFSFIDRLFINFVIDKAVLTAENP